MGCLFGPLLSLPQSIWLPNKVLCGFGPLWIIPVLFFKKYILLIMLLQLSHFLLFIPLHSAHPLLTHIPPFSSCPWVIHISSLVCTFPILFLTLPSLFSTYHLCYLFSVPFPPVSPSHSCTDNLPCVLHFCDSVPILVVCLVCFCFYIQLSIAVSLLSFHCS